MSRDQVREGELRGEWVILLLSSSVLLCLSVELGSAPGCQQPVPHSEVGILEVLCPLGSLFSWFVGRLSWPQPSCGCPAPSCAHSWEMLLPAC